VPRPCVVGKGGPVLFCLECPAACIGTYGAHHLHLITCSCYRRGDFFTHCTQSLALARDSTVRCDGLAVALTCRPLLLFLPRLSKRLRSRIRDPTSNWP
jgi:hypothetical protein